MALEYTPTQLAAHIRKVWSKEIGLDANEEQILIPKFKRLEKIEGELAYRKFGTLSGNSLADSAVGSGLTPSGKTEITVSATPATKYVMVVVNLNTAARCAFDPKVPLRTQMQKALYEMVERAGAAQAGGLTTNVIGSADDPLSDPLIRQGKRLLIKTGKEKYKVGKKKFWAVIHPDDFETLDGIEAFYRADIRGDKENPLVEGAVYQVRGGYWTEGGAIQQDTVTRNVMFFPDETFGIGFNKEYAVKMEEYELVYKLIAWVDFGLMTCWDDLGVLLQTKPAA